MVDFSRPRVKVRRLSAEELKLWRQVTELVTPRLPRQVEAVEVVEEAPPVGQSKHPPIAHQKSAEKPTLEKPVKKRIPALAPLEPQVRRRLTRGRETIDDVLDLHGSTQDVAHRSVIDFLVRNQRRGSKIVLIVTGKGGRAYGGQIGILKRNVPMWLQDPSLRPMIVSVEEAAPPHGGAGALYVRLRKFRPVDA